MNRKLEIPLFIARKIDAVAEKNKMTFSDAAIFLIKKVLTPNLPKKSSKKSKGEA